MLRLLCARLRRWEQREGGRRVGSGFRYLGGAGDGHINRDATHRLVKLNLARELVSILNALHVNLLQVR